MQVVAKWIDVEEIKKLHDKCVEKAVELSRLDQVTDYDKGIVAGKILAFRELMNDECPHCGESKLKTLLVCDECYPGHKDQ